MWNHRKVIMTSTMTAFSAKKKSKCSELRQLSKISQSIGSLKFIVFFLSKSFNKILIFCNELSLVWTNLLYSRWSSVNNIPYVNHFHYNFFINSVRTSLCNIVYILCVVYTLCVCEFFFFFLTVIKHPASPTITKRLNE